MQNAYDRIEIMKQRIRVMAICRKDDEILFLKRKTGRAEVAADYELPTGKIVLGEQPDEAIARFLYENLNVKLTNVKLLDVITFVNLDNASRLANLYIVFETDIPVADLKVKGIRYDSYKWTSPVNVQGLNLDEASRAALDVLNERVGTEARAEKKNITSSLGVATVYTDGGSRGNPGPSGIGYYIVDEDGNVLKSGGEFIGFSSSRLAEYYGLKEGIQQALELGLKKVKFVSDSLMLVNQMNGVYKVKNRDLMTIHADVLKLLSNLDEYSFIHVTRDQNRHADAEANRVIDEYENNIRDN